MTAIDQAHGETWSLYHGDSVEVLPDLPSDSIDLWVTSPPFGDLFVYSASERDLGNNRTPEAFFTHLGFITDQMLRLLKPGRVAAVHVMDIPATLVDDGYIGLKDFSGDVIRHFIAHGWVFDGRVPIDKNPQAQSIRTHAKGLTFQQMEKDRSWSRPALPDYILKFRKPGNNAVPVVGGDINRNLWIDWADPTWPNDHDRCADAGGFATWYGISEGDTLNKLVKHGYAGLKASKDAEDGQHICPLQLGTIERCVRLWSNEGEVAADPFTGIGSVGYEALRRGRRFVGSEFKGLYYRAARWNLGRVESDLTTPGLLDELEAAS